MFCVSKVYTGDGDAGNGFAALITSHAGNGPVVVVGFPPSTVAAR